MDEPNCPVLALVVDRYDEHDRPVCPEAVARALGRDEGAVTDRLAELQECEFLAPVDGCYRPTVTGREFLALDVECGPVVVDTDCG